MRFLLQWGGLCTASALVFVACSSSQVRGPAAAHNRDAQRLHSLRTAAENGILFVIADSVFQDRPSRQVASCKKIEDPVWADNLFAVLEKFDQSPGLYSKFYTIQIRRGNAAKSFIEKDSAGASHLVIEYSKRRVSEKITPMTEISCPNNIADYVNKDMDITTFEYPSADSVVAAVSAAENRAPLERYNFDRRFLTYLADQSVLLKVEPTHLIDKNENEEFFLTGLLNKFGAEISQGNLRDIEFWIKEIGVNSKQAAPIEFFGLKKDNGLNYGIRVDSSGKYARKINGFSDPTYLYIGYKTEVSGFNFATLSELNSCLANLTKSYRAADFPRSYDMDTDSYLYPGYMCRGK